MNWKRSSQQKPTRLRHNTRESGAFGPVPTSGKKSTLRQWIKPALYIAPLLITVILAGKGNISDIPEIPGQLYQMSGNAWSKWRLERALTGTWTTSTARTQANTTIPGIALDLAVSNGKVDGTIASSGFRKWGSIYPTALITGAIEGQYLKLTVFDFIEGNRTIFARLKIRIMPEEPSPDHIAQTPEPMDYTHLAVEVEWQKAEVLPRSFTATLR
jgi:hypothetical protein